MEPVLVVRSSSADETRAIGRALGREVQPGDVLTLSGPFGAGKTTLMQGIAEGLGARDVQGSPSFALVNEYLPGQSGTRLPLFHMDLYRLTTPDELLDIGLDDYLARGGVVAIEWPAVALDLLPAERLDLVLAYADDEARSIQLRAAGERARRLAAATARASDPGAR